MLEYVKTDHNDRAHDDSWFVVAHDGSWAMGTRR